MTAKSNLFARTNVMKILLFDVDLTLVATGGAGVRALDRAIGGVLGLQEAMTGIAPHGKTDPFIVREVLEANDLTDSIDVQSVIAEILNQYLIFLQAEVTRSEGYCILPGILELLTEIHSRPDIRLGLATGNLERGARIKLEPGGLNPYFTFGGYGSDAEERVEVVRKAAEQGNRDPAGAVPPSDIFVIGDTPRDIEAGKGAGFQTVGVATGSYTVADLEAAGADLVIQDFTAGRAQFLRAIRIL